MTANPSAAVYFQRSRVVQEEFGLIEAATERENLVNKLAEVIREVKEEIREFNDDTILETFKLLNLVREATIRTILSISKWQESFTKLVRPTIFQGDFMIEKLIKQIDLVNASKIRKVFNFQFFRGNVLLLPFPSLSSGEVMRVTPHIAKEIKYFSQPKEDVLISCYQVLIDSLPEQIFKERVVSLEKWLIEPWTPRIYIASAPTKSLRPTSATPAHKITSRPTSPIVQHNHKKVDKEKAADANKQKTALRSRSNGTLPLTTTATTMTNTTSTKTKETSKKLPPTTNISTTTTTTTTTTTDPTTTNTIPASGSTPTDTTNNNTTETSPVSRRRKVLNTQQILSLTTLDESALQDNGPTTQSVTGKSSEVQRGEGDEESIEEIRDLNKYCHQLKKTFSLATSSRKPRHTLLTTTTATNTATAIGGSTPVGSLPPATTTTTLPASPTRPLSASAYNRITFSHIVKIPPPDPALVADKTVPLPTILAGGGGNGDADETESVGSTEGDDPAAMLDALLQEESRSVNSEEAVQQQEKAMAEAAALRKKQHRPSKVGKRRSSSVTTIGKDTITSPTTTNLKEDGPINAATVLESLLSPPTASGGTTNVVSSSKTTSSMEQYGLSKKKGRQAPKLNTAAFRHLFSHQFRPANNTNSSNTIVLPPIV